MSIGTEGNLKKVSRDEILEALNARIRSLSLILWAMDVHGRGTKAGREGFTDQA